MSVRFLETKFHIPPIRPEYVARPRLIERLNEGLHRKLTLVSAPAGFGKTSLISEWIAGCGRESSWLSLDRRDNDPVRFLSYLIGAVQTIHEQMGNEALRLIQSSQAPSAETVMTSFINEIVSTSISLVLIFDDYHVIECNEIDGILDFLIEHLPPQMHLVISTREDPQLAMARLRASGQLTEMRASDLRFQPVEVAEFLNEGMGLGLSTEDIRSLEQRTEGWIASLQLAALSIRKKDDASGFIRSFTGSHRMVLDYLVEEVLSNQTEEIQGFLIQTSILDRMCGSLCDDLTDRQNGQRTLEKLEDSNLFIVSLDDDRRWYRYHHLFADLLRQRLRESQGEQISVLHSKAGQWYSKNGFDHEAIEHALQARDFEYAASLIEAYIGDNFERTSQATRERWLAEFPDDVAVSQPSLVLLEAWTLLVGGQLNAAEQCLETVEASLVQTKGEDQETATRRTQLLAKAAAIRTLIASHYGLHSKTISYGQQSLEILQEGESSWRCVVLVTLVDAYAAEGRIEEAHRASVDALSAGRRSNDIILLMTVNLRNAEILRQQGKLKETLGICRHMLSEAQSNGIADTPAVGWLLGIYGEALAEINDIDSALDQAKKGADRADTSGDVYFIGFSRLYLTRVLFTCGDLTGAMKTVLSMNEIVDESDVPFSIVHRISAWKARIWLAEGNLEAARQWATERDFDYNDKPSRLREMEYFVLARILIALKRSDEAIKVLKWAQVLPESDRRVAGEIESLSLQALAHHAGGDVAEALVLLNRALSLAEPEGFVRTFVDEGPPMARLLYDAASQDIKPDYIRRLLVEFPAMETESADSRIAEQSQNQLMEHLSERELDVLRLVAEGMSNEQIGTTLFISTHTVKVHTRNIYAKLDSHNRTEAVARARYYGILTSD